MNHWVLHSWEQGKRRRNVPLVFSFSPWGISHSVLALCAMGTLRIKGLSLVSLPPTPLFFWFLKDEMDTTKIHTGFWPYWPRKLTQKYQTRAKHPQSSPLSQVFYVTVYLGGRADLNQQKNHEETEYLCRIASCFPTRWNPPRQLLRRSPRGREIQQTRLSLTGLSAGKKNHQSSDQIVLKDN